MTAYGNGDCVKFISVFGVRVTGGLSTVCVEMGMSFFRGEVILDMPLIF